MNTISAIILVTQFLLPIEITEGYMTDGPRLLLAEKYSAEIKINHDVLIFHVMDETNETEHFHWWIAYLTNAPNDKLNGWHCDWWRVLVFND